MSTPQLVSWAQGQIKDEPTTHTVVKAVNAYVSQLPVAAGITADVDGTLSGAKLDSVQLGALMLAVRVHRRRNSPNGIEAITGDAVAYVARYDPDVSRFLELDRPVVG